MKLLLPLIALVGLANTQAEAGFWKKVRRSFGVHVSAPVVYQPVAPYYAYQPMYQPVVYQPVYQPVVYRPVVKKPHFGFSFGTHGAGFSFWS